MSNCLEFVIADQALIELGAAKVPINDMLSPQEVRYILDDSDARIVITDTTMYERIDGNRLGRGAGHHPHRRPGRRPQRLALQRCLHEGSNARSNLRRRPRSASADDLGMILYTAEQLGRQKGVVHTQAGLAVNMLAHVIEMCLGDDERVLVSTPLPHAAWSHCASCLLRGAAIYLERGFSADGAIDLIEEHGITFMFMVPTMVLSATGQHRGSRRKPRLHSADHPATAPHRCPGLDSSRDCSYSGPVFMQLYGQSEAPDFLTRLTREDHVANDFQRLGSCGRAALLMEVAVVDDDDQPLPPGAVGEVVGRGPYIMRGLPQHEGGVREGDCAADGFTRVTSAWMDDDGYLYIVDRLKDMIISGGMNVYSTEVEQAAPAMRSSGTRRRRRVPASRLGRSRRRVHRPHRRPRVQRSAGRETCRELLAVYKRPKRIVVLPEFP